MKWYCDAGARRLGRAGLPLSPLQKSSSAASHPCAQSLWVTSGIHGWQPKRSTTRASSAPRFCRRLARVCPNFMRSHREEVWFFGRNGRRRRFAKRNAASRPSSFFLQIQSSQSLPRSSDLAVVGSKRSVLARRRDNLRDSSAILRLSGYVKY